MLQKLRTLTSDTLVYGFSTIAGRFLTFLLTPLYTNFISQSELGAVSYLYSIIAFVNILYSFGLDSAFFKFYHPSNPESSKQTFSNSLLAIALLGGILTVLTFIFAEPIANILAIPNAFLIRLSSLVVFFDSLALIPFSMLRMARKSKKYAGLKFLTIFINVAANLILVAALHGGIRAVFISGTLSSLAGLLILLPEIKRNILLKFDRKLFREMMIFGLPTVPSAFSAIMLQIADRPLLKILTNDATIGLYQANYRLAIPMQMMVSMFELAWKPFFLREASEPDAKKLFGRILTYFTLACGIVFLITGFFIEYVVQLPFIGGRFINPVYWSGLGIVPIVLGAYYFNGLFTNFAAGAYIEKRTKYLPLVTGAAALINIALILILTPIWGIIGTAWATFYAYLASAGIMYVLSQKIYPIKYEWRRITTFVIAVFILFWGIKTLTNDWNMILAGIFRLSSIAGLFLLLNFIGFFRDEEIGILKKLFRKK